jgi:adenylate cyclase
VGTGSDLRGWRARLRLSSALVLLAFVICHLAAHSLLLVAQPVAEEGLAALMRPWRSAAGTTLLVAAFLVHYANALWSIYERRSLRLRAWEWAQLGLGLCIPALLALHVASTRLAEETMGVDTGYGYVLVEYWVIAPYVAVLQAVAVVTVWLHACIGIHFWLRTKGWYPRARAGLGALALLLPTLALSGFLTAGGQVVRAAAADEEFVEKTLADSNVGEGSGPAIDEMAEKILYAHLTLVLLAFAARELRRWIQARGMPPFLSHPSGQRLPVLAGASILETLREHGVPHASVCGGRARCTTCRVQVGSGRDKLLPPAELEARALARIGATPGMRLACQVRPVADLAITPLCAADATAADGFVRGGMEGSERLITIMFIDLRGSTTLGEAKLPYDVLFILNRFFEEMKNALEATGGHYAQFTGDGLMALYGLHADPPARGAADAIRGAREMLMRLEQLNLKLKAELPQPLKIGIGIHHAEAIVGQMGPPKAQTVTAIGDTANTAARLESLTKEYGASLVISRRAAEAAGLDVAGLKLHEAPVKGRVQSVQFYALESIPEIRR